MANVFKFVALCLKKRVKHLIMVHFLFENYLMFSS